MSALRGEAEMVYLTACRFSQSGIDQIEIPKCSGLLPCRAVLARRLNYKFW